MSDTPKWVTQVQQKLANVDEAERDRLLTQIKMGAVAQAPDEEVGKPPVSSLREYLETDIPNPGAVIEPGVFVPGEITLFHARAGKGKSTLAINCLVRWAAGLPFLSELPHFLVPKDNKPVRSIIVENEGSAGMFQERIKDILTASDMTKQQKDLALDNIMIWGDGSYSGLKVDNDADLGMIRRACREHKPDILFLDPFRSIWKGDENDLSEMENALDGIQQVANELDFALYLPHHERKTNENPDGMDAARGGTTLEGKVATMIRWTHARNGDYSTMAFTKMRYAPKSGVPEPVDMVFNFETNGYRDRNDDARERRILDSMKIAKSEWYGMTDLAAELEEDQNKVRPALNKLAAGDDPTLVKKSNPGRGGGFRYKFRSELEMDAEPGEGNMTF